MAAFDALSMLKAGVPLEPALEPGPVKTPGLVELAGQDAGPQQVELGR